MLGRLWPASRTGNIVRGPRLPNGGLQALGPGPAPGGVGPRPPPRRRSGGCLEGPEAGGGLESEAIGAWDRLAEEARSHDGTTIISHEILAHASPTQTGRALESLGHRWDAAPGEQETEVHVVISVRDLVRQVPAEWQENVKHRATLSYGEFLAQVRDPERQSRVASWFWAVQEIPAILERWAHDLPPSTCTS